MKKQSHGTPFVLIFKKMDHKIQIDYSDDGKRISADIITLKNGLLNIESRVAAINGILTFDPASGKGFKASVTIRI